MSARIPLEVIPIVTPCELDWESLPGSGSTRVCPQCHKEVHNLSAMARAEAEELVGDGSTPMCIYYELNPRGRIRTLEYRNNPPRLKRTRLWIAVAGVIAVVGTTCQYLLFGARLVAPPRLAGSISPPCRTTGPLVTTLTPTVPAASEFAPCESEPEAEDPEIP